MQRAVGRGRAAVRGPLRLVRRTSSSGRCPAQRPHPPLVIGGESPAAFRRARAAGAWYGWEHTPEQIAGVRAQLGEDVEITLTPGAARAARSRARAGVRRGRRLAARPAAAGHDGRGDGRADRGHARDVDHRSELAARRPRDGGPRVGEQLAAALAQPVAGVLVEAGGVRARRADAERERLPPLLEARGPERRPRARRPRRRPGRPRAAASRERAFSRAGEAGLVAHVGIELARRAPEGRERAALARVVPDAGRDHAAGLGDARHLAQPGDRVGHEVHDELRERGVEGGVAERQLLGRRLRGLDVREALARAPRRTSPTGRRRRPLAAPSAGDELGRSARRARCRRRARAGLP